MSFQRVVLIVLDGVGVGALPDADLYHDQGAHTLRHVVEQAGGIELPNLQQLGLGNIVQIPGVDPSAQPLAAWGKMAERSFGKDTTTGHWELAGLLTTEPAATYPTGFPGQIIDEFRTATGLDPLGNIAASGTDIINLLGEEHVATGRPIIYTSADSVFQIAAHEEVIPPEALYEICRKTRRLLDPYRVGRVIARPFIGTSAEGFVRTSRRHDFSMPPSAPTLLDRMSDAGLGVTGIGKIGDIFAGRGLTRSITTESNLDGTRQLLNELSSGDAGLLFVNLVDFDMLYGHRLDCDGFARALEAFDRDLPDIMAQMNHDDLLILTADHGCDPLVSGTDHTREYVPLLVWHKHMCTPRALGVRNSFSDVAATIADLFTIELEVGESFYKGLIRMADESVGR